MTTDISAPQSSSILDARLPKDTKLISTSVKDKWRFVAETVEFMYKSFYKFRLEQFSSEVFRMYETDLMTITEAISDSSTKEKDHDKIIEYLGECRRKASQASECYDSKDPTQRDIGKKAAITLQIKLKNALEYIESINKKLNLTSDAKGKKTGA